MDDEVNAGNLLLLSYGPWDKHVLGFLYAALKEKVAIATHCRQDQDLQGANILNGIICIETIDAHSQNTMVIE